MMILRSIDQSPAMEGVIPLLGTRQPQFGGARTRQLAMREVKRCSVLEPPTTVLSQPRRPLREDEYVWKLHNMGDAEVPHGPAGLGIDTPEGWRLGQQLVRDLHSYWTAEEELLNETKPTPMPGRIYLEELFDREKDQEYGALLDELFAPLIDLGITFGYYGHCRGDSGRRDGKVGMPSIQTDDADKRRWRMRKAAESYSAIVPWMSLWGFRARHDDDYVRDCLMLCREFRAEELIVFSGFHPLELQWSNFQRIYREVFPEH